MKKHLLIFTLLFYISNIYSQSKLWLETNYETTNIIGKQYIFPDQFKTFQLDYNEAKNILATTPLHDFNGNIYNSNIEIKVPLPDGSFELFKIVESPVYEAGFSAKYPNIKTYLAYAPNHPEWYSRFDITPLGFHGFILGDEFGSIYIDPITHLGEDIETYLVYYKKDFKTDKIFECGVEDFAPTQNNKSGNIVSRFGSCELRTYRLALAATGEYTQFHGGTKANALAAQVTTMNRVNGVYERDLSIHMNIIADNDDLIYTNGITDPYTNNSGFDMLGENQTNIDNVIGSANYDIGHVFSTGGGGVASLRSPCSNNAKARGVTGSFAPVSDPFDIDYVCHEMGHQFGGNHTFNGTNGSCGGGNRNLGTAFEPGSGSTIQAYAGICTGQNVQSNSNDYFHGISLEEIGDFVTGATHNCPVKTSLSNNGPSVNYPNNTITIPANTPFSLTAVGSDPDNDVLTYCWEQMNNENSTQPPVASATGGPNFRSFSPTTNPTRYFPNLADIIAGNNPTWEVLPTVTRTLDFRVVVRDNAPGGGCNDHTDITVNVTNSAGPFIVNYPNNNGITWDGNTTETVTWDVANTNSAPVSCSNVNILISYDGGVSFPDTLAENVSNDGSQVITVPNIATNDAYIMVQCENGTFFDVSNNNFTIDAVTNDFTLNTSSSNTNICIGENVTYSIDIDKVGIFNSNVTLNTSGLPTGVSASFSNNNSAPVFNSTLTLSNTGSLSSGIYNFNVTATGSTGTKTSNLSFTVIQNLSGNITLTSPSNGASAISIPAEFDWNNINGSNFYEIIISTDAAQSNIIENADNLTNNNYTANNLQTNTTYYWSVVAFNSCDSLYSNVNTFTTENCVTFNSTDIPITISTTGTPTITSDIIINGATGTIADVNVINLIGEHSWINDLIFTLTSPTGTEVVLVERICNNQDDFDINFDDNAANNNYPCPPVDGGFYIPEEALSAFNGEDANGTWTLSVEDVFNQDGGELQSWGLNICFNPPPCLTTFSTQNITPACDSVSVLSTWYFNSTTFNDTLIGQNSGGCDSIITYNITINNSSPETVINNTTCNPSNAGSNSVTLTNTAGCDSVVTTNTTLLTSPTNTVNVAECDSALVNSTWYYTSNNFNQTFTAANGCDSVVTFNIAINNSSAETIINNTTCNPSNVGANTVTLTNAAGCDSIVTTNTTLLSSFTNAVNISECDSAFVNNVWYFASNSFNQTYTAVNGCDSVVTFNIIINNSSTETIINNTTCNPSNVGSNTVTLTNIAGCDSIVTTNTTLLSSFTNAVNISECDSAFVNNIWYFSSNSFNQTFTAANGCDSVVAFNITINNSSAETIINNTTCNPSNVGSNTITLTNIAGCDSIVTTNTTLSNTTTNNINIEACDSTFVNNNWYYNSVNISETFMGSNNCDSIVNYNISINNSVQTLENISGCDSVIYNGTTYYSPQNFTDNFTSSNTCDSTHTTNLNIYSIDTSVVQNNATLTANQTGAAYQWLNCNNNNAPILNATDSSFTATQNGSFALEITLGNCSYITSCYSVNSISIHDIELASILEVYPNPTNGEISVNFNKEIEQASLSVYTIEGKLLNTKEAYNTSIIPVNINASAGVYLLKVETTNAQAIVKVIKE